jgi:hypothetical protein
MKNNPKNQKEYYQNRIREYEKRTGKSMNVNNISKIYDYNIQEAVYNTPAALDMMKKHGCYIYHEHLSEEDSLSNGTNWLKFAFAHVNGKTYKYYYETKKWGHEVVESQIELYKIKNWKAAKLEKSGFSYSDPGEDYLPYAVENEHVGSDFDDFAKDHNIKLTRDINWALKMLGYGKIMTRESNRNLVLFPPNKYNNQDAKITVDDLFAEDWIVVQTKTFKEVLDDFYAGKTIRRKSWDSSYGFGKYANDYKVSYSDLLADDWESSDVIAEVDQIQNRLLKDRNEH